jgi:hypothetical protein
MSAYVYLPFAEGMTISVFGTTNQSAISWRMSSIERSDSIKKANQSFRPECGRYAPERDSPAGIGP